MTKWLVFTLFCASCIDVSGNLENNTNFSIPDLEPLGEEIIVETVGEDELPDDWYRGAFMQIYVRGYRDSDGDGIGDLQGVTEKLDYLQDLGITGLWLMPITGLQQTRASQ